MSVLSLFQLSKFVFYVRVVFGELERKEEEKLTKILFSQLSVSFSYHSGFLQMNRNWGRVSRYFLFPFFFNLFWAMEVLTWSWGMNVFTFFPCSLSWGSFSSLKLWMLFFKSNGIEKKIMNFLPHSHKSNGKGKLIRKYFQCCLLHFKNLGKEIVNFLPHS